MVEVLDDKREATRYRILVEIADRQPAVSQGEIAEVVGVTSQAVSEYIRELVTDGLVVKQGRSRYQVTNEGVDWLLGHTTDIRRFTERVADDVLGGVQEDAAIATTAITEGDTVTLEMRDGMLHATPGGDGPATGTATTDAEPGHEVGVSGFEGVIDFSPGAVTVYQVSPVRSGGSKRVDTTALERACDESPLVLAAGIEAVVALDRIGRSPDGRFAVGEVAARAAERGVDVMVVATADEVGRVTDPLREAGTAYTVQD
ncbi:MAG: MarR family transcriptional regulator [Halodesulfurarchaeum sp.]|nr:MarR family transcriptional regulator [Halodesulfurarchaeum sp.]